MGCCSSTQVYPGAALEERIQAALREIIVYKDKHREDTQATFTRIILKFPVLRVAIASIRDVFKHFDTDGSGSIDKAELRECMEALGAHLTDLDIQQMFHYANFSNKGSLSFKEFVVCLCIGSILQLFPLLKAYSAVNLTPLASADAADTVSAVNRRSSNASDIAYEVTVAPMAPPDVSKLKGSALYGQGQRLVKALRIILEAYVLFDKDGSGMIDRSEVLAMIEEENQKSQMNQGPHKRKKEGSGNVLLSKERWMELDFDDSGEISFAEFVHAFMAWVGIEDEDEEEEDVHNFSLTTDTNSAAAALVSSRKSDDKNLPLRTMTDAELDEALTLTTARRNGSTTYPQIEVSAEGALVKSSRNLFDTTTPAPAPAGARASNRNLLADNPRGSTRNLMAVPEGGDRPRLVSGPSLRVISSKQHSGIYGPGHSPPGVMPDPATQAMMGASSRRLDSLGRGAVHGILKHAPPLEHSVSNGGGDPGPIPSPASPTASTAPATSTAPALAPATAAGGSQHAISPPIAAVSFD